MKRVLLLVAAVTVGSFGALAQTASADPDSIACTLEKKGIYHSPIGSACSEDPWDE